MIFAAAQGPTNIYDTLIVAIPGILAFVSTIVMGILNNKKTNRVQETIEEKFKEDAIEKFKIILNDAFELANKDKDILKNKIKDLQEELINKKA